jgi:hypothetical protein
MIRLANIVGLQALREMDELEEEQWRLNAIKKFGASIGSIVEPSIDKVNPPEDSPADDAASDSGPSENTPPVKSGKFDQRAKLSMMLRGMKEMYKLSEEQLQKISSLEEKLHPSIDPIGLDDNDIDSDDEKTDYEKDDNNNDINGDRNVADDTGRASLKKKDDDECKECGIEEDIDPAIKSATDRSKNASKALSAALKNKNIEAANAARKDKADAMEKASNARKAATVARAQATLSNVK